MMSLNVSVEVGLGGASKARFVKAARLIQRQVKRHTEIRNKWRDVTLKVQAASATASKNRHINEPISVFIVATHAAPASEDESIEKGQTLPSVDLIPQYGLQDSYQEDKNLITLQQSDGGKILIEMPGSSVKQAAWVGLFLSLFISIQITVLNKPLEEAILLGISAVVLLHQLTKLTKGDGLLASNNKRANRLLTRSCDFKELLLVTAFMGSISGAYAGDPIKDICPIDGALNAAVDGNVLEEGDKFKVAAACIVFVIAIGGAILWTLKPSSKFEIDQGLKRTPVARESNPIFTISPKLESETVLY